MKSIRNEVKAPKKAVTEKFPIFIGVLNCGLKFLSYLNTIKDRFTARKNLIFCSH